MAKSESPDPYRSDRDVTSGTHPLAMLSIVGGLVSVATGACCLVHPILAVAAQGGAGTVALVTGAIVQVQVSRQRFDPTNRFQARIGMIAGAIGLLSAIVWAVLMKQHGAMPFVELR